MELDPRGLSLTNSSVSSLASVHNSLAETLHQIGVEIGQGQWKLEYQDLFAHLLLNADPKNVKEYQRKRRTQKVDGEIDDRIHIYRPDIMTYDNDGDPVIIEVKTKFFNGNAYKYGPRSQEWINGRKKNRRPMMEKTRTKYEKQYRKKMRDYDKGYFPGDASGGKSPVDDQDRGPLEGYYDELNKTMIICTEMGAMNRETGDLIHYMASKVSPLVVGRWDVTGSNTCRYKVESQIEGMIKRRLAGVLMRGYANHFFSRLHLVKVEWKDKNVYCDDPLDGTEKEGMDVYDMYNRRDYGNGNVPSHGIGERRGQEFM